MVDIFKGDLHCHSTFSDGSLSPKELIVLANERGLKALSITDHDSVGAYMDDEIYAYAKDLGIELVTGIEISSEWHKAGVHILGYQMDYRSEPFLAFIQSVQANRVSRIKKMVEKLHDHGIEITFDLLQDFVSQSTSCSSFSIGRAHIGRFLVEKGYVSNMREAFEKYIKDGACCYVSGEKYTSLQVIDKIHEANGIAIIAHPHLFKKKRFGLELMGLPFDGLEGYYGTITHNQEKWWIQKAKERNWIVSGGSDFHGPLKPYITLGCSWVNEENYKRIVSR